MKNEKHKIRKEQYLSILAAFIFVLVLVIDIYVSIRHVNEITTQSCFEDMNHTTEQLAYEIEHDIIENERVLMAFANIMASNEECDRDQIKKTLLAYKQYDLQINLFVLFPDDTILLQDGTTMDVSGVLSFEEESEAGCHISSERGSLVNGGNMVLHHYVPINKNGALLAMLYREIDLEEFTEKYAVHAYEGGSQLYLIEGESGDFFVDTWHTSYANITMLRDRDLLPGYSAEDSIQDIAEGRSGSLAFRSKNAGVDFYLYYSPVNVNDWMVMLSTPETVVFQQVELIQDIMMNLMMVAIVVFVFFLIWFMLRTYGNIKLYEGQLNQVHYMSKLQELLFDAHRNHDGIVEALAEIGRVMHAQNAFLILLDKTIIHKVYTGDKKVRTAEGDFIGSNFMDIAPNWCRLCEQHQSIIIRDVVASEYMCQDEGFILKNLKVHNLILTPVWNSYKELSAVLGVVDMAQVPKTAAMLEQGTLSFSMSVENINAHMQIEQMGMVDYSTGVRNSNSYIKFVREFDGASVENIACIYSDVNGLHELNNQHGHEVGDQMLRFVAQSFVKAFPNAVVYRVGGDEFVVICLNEERTETERCLRIAKETIIAEGYHVSVGMSWRNTDMNIKEMIEEADSKMYHDKVEYYRTRDRRMRRE